jgi:hypothetical protein
MTTSVVIIEIPVGEDHKMALSALLGRRDCSELPPITHYVHFVQSSAERHDTTVQLNPFYGPFFFDKKNYHFGMYPRRSPL